MESDRADGRTGVAYVDDPMTKPLDREIGVPDIVIPDCSSVKVVTAKTTFPFE